MGHLAKAIAHAKAIAFARWSVWAKNKKCQKHAKTILREQQSCSVEKTARKNTKYSRNDTILKMGHVEKAIAHGKATAFAKLFVWAKI